MGRKQPGNPDLPFPGAAVPLLCARQGQIACASGGRVAVPGCSGGNRGSKGLMAWESWRGAAQLSERCPEQRLLLQDVLDFCQCPGSVEASTGE